MNRAALSKKQVMAKVQRVLAFRIIPFKALIPAQSQDTVILSSFPRIGVRKNWTVVGPWSKKLV